MTEFGSYPPAYYDTAIRQGRILVSNERVLPDHVLSASDVLTHTVHRHEPAVADTLRIVEETDSLWVVDKPGTLPVHPCGGYHHQSLTSMLKPSFGIHRLDRLTSGLVLLAKDSPTAQLWTQALRERNATKVYIARVRGRFPSQASAPWLKSIPAYSDSLDRKEIPHGCWVANGKGELVDGCSFMDLAQGGIVISEGSCDEVLREDSDIEWLHLTCPTRIEKAKDGVCRCGTFGELTDDEYKRTVKSAETSFAVVRYDEASDSTVVICRPLTGRTHQIRLHLQYLNHPIANDPNYGGVLWYGNAEGRDTATEVQKKLTEMNEHGNSNALVTTDVPATEAEVAKISESSRRENESMDEFIRRTCVWCSRGHGCEDRGLWEFLTRSAGIWLHAWMYRVTLGDKEYSYKTTLPSWVNADVKTGSR